MKITMSLPATVNIFLKLAKLFPAQKLHVLIVNEILEYSKYAHGTL
jgi:hypothetical protein